ncbi:outer membrane protein assembly factor BamA [Rhizobium sp. 18065]|uniref:outer membrane protein assembly factor BamA n=1 Tax=Rhizobium sp. 18065 TaxID=2681411 RepID=UPI00135BE090|nr:outer membrane protein assembly factor BamA [Rhizobium sp. 18065]
MKAGSRFLNAVSAVALSAGIVSSGAGVAVLVSAVAAEAAVVRSIDVRGAQRVGAEAVRSNLSIKTGESFSNADIDESVKQLYATGFFSDVRISVSGGTLVVTVVENQLINQVVFNGNRKIKDDKLVGLVQTQPMGPYSDSLIAADIQRIKEAYAAIGRSDVDVTTQVVPVTEGRVNLAFVINEGERTKISQINFVGNNAYSDGRLASVLNTKESGMLSFLTRKDVYNEDKLRADEEVLRQFYYNHGYADFRVISSEATLNEAGNEYVINITVDEGARYKFGNVAVESTVDGIDGKELEGLLETNPGSTYSARDVQKSMEAISRRVSAAGYPFARVVPRGDRNFETNTIGVTYLVDQGERAYVERIEVRGNTRTRDFVIRREFDISEGDAFNQETISRAKRRLEALGFFSSVNISTQAGSASDRVIVIVDVQDQPTGSFGVGAGYSVGDGGLVLEASVEEKNFLGRGQFIRVAAGGGFDDTQTYNFSFTEPYFLGYRLAAGFDLFKSSTSSNSYYDYEEQGGTIRVTAPITEDLATTIRYTYKELEYINDGAYGADGVSGGGDDQLAAPYIDLIDGSPWKQSILGNTFVYNTVDDRQNPHDGLFVSVTQEYAGLGGDSDFYKLYGRARMYHTLSDEYDLVGSIAASAGHVMPTNGDLNVFDQFKIGGKEIRGFENDGIGPRIGGDSIGGTTYFAASAEATFPMPLIPQDLNFRGAVFADAGTLYGNDVSNSAGVVGTDLTIRASVGAGILWNSPFGALRLDYAVPVAKEDFDEVQEFRFSMANQF